MPTIGNTWVTNRNKVTVTTTVDGITERTWVKREVRADISPPTGSRESQVDGGLLWFDVPGGAQTGGDFVFARDVQGIIGVTYDSGTGDPTRPSQEEQEGSREGYDERASSPEQS